MKSAFHVCVKRVSLKRIEITWLTFPSWTHRFSYFAPEKWPKLRNENQFSFLSISFGHAMYSTYCNLFVFIVDFMYNFRLDTEKMCCIHTSVVWTSCMNEITSPYWSYQSNKIILVVQLSILCILIEVHHYIQLIWRWPVASNYRLVQLVMLKLKKNYNLLYVPNVVRLDFKRLSD